MALLAVVRDVCAAVGVELPTSVFSNINNNRTQQEMLALANEMAQRTAYNTRDWTILKNEMIFTGEDVMVLPGPPLVYIGKTEFLLPSDYLRMPITANMWRHNSIHTPMRFIPDTDEWLHRRTIKQTDAWGEWTMMGGKVHFWPELRGLIPATETSPEIPQETVRSVYLSRNCILQQGGVHAANFVGDTDSYLLGDRLLKLGMVWQWKANKGSPYAEDMGTFQDALANASGADSPAPIIRGRTSTPWNATVAYPWPVPT